MEDRPLQSGQTRASDTRDSEQRRISAAARRVLQKVEEEGDGDDTMEAWQQRAEEVVYIYFIT
jgi:hypothetical protein